MNKNNKNKNKKNNSRNARGNQESFSYTNGLKGRSGEGEGGGGEPWKIGSKEKEGLYEARGAGRAGESRREGPEKREAIIYSRSYRRQICMGQQGEIEKDKSYA